MVNVLILSPTPALRAGLRALLSSDPDLVVTVSASRLGSEPGDLQEIPPEVQVIVATPGGIDLADPALRPDLALLLISDDVSVLRGGQPQTARVKVGERE